MHTSNGLVLKVLLVLAQTVFLQPNRNMGLGPVVGIVYKENEKDKINKFTIFLLGRACSFLTTAAPLAVLAEMIAVGFLADI